MSARSQCIIFTVFCILLLLGVPFGVYAEHDVFKTDTSYSFQSDEERAVSYVVSIEPKSTASNVTVRIIESDRVLIDYKSLRISSSSAEISTQRINRSSIFVHNINRGEELTVEFKMYMKYINDYRLDGGYVNISSENPSAQSSVAISDGHFDPPWRSAPTPEPQSGFDFFDFMPVVINASVITVAGFAFSIISIILTGIGVLATIDQDFRQKVRQNVQLMRKQSVSVRSALFYMWQFVLLTLADFFESLSHYLNKIGHKDKNK